MNFTVGQIGTFDVNNLGDLLFPFLTAERLELSPAEIVVLAPTSQRPIFEDAFVPQAVNSLLHNQEQKIDLFLLGGGDILHTKELNFFPYNTDSVLPFVAGGSLLSSALLLGLLRGVPVAWNALGIPFDFPKHCAWMLQHDYFDYVSVRDTLSANHLPQGNNFTIPQIVPDSIAEIARFWPAGTLQSSLSDAFKKHQAEIPERYLVFHINIMELFHNTLPAIAIAKMAAAVNKLCALFAARPVFLTINTYCDTTPTLNEISKLLPNMLILDKCTTLREMVAVLAHSCGYAGSSLHGLIIALSYGHPGYAVMTADFANRKKIDGHIAIMDLPNIAFNSWNELELGIDNIIFKNGKWFLNYLDRASQLLTPHWTSIRSLLAKKKNDPIHLDYAKLVPWIFTAPDILENIINELTSSRQKIINMQRLIKKINQEKVILNQQNAILNQQNALLLSSISWRLTRPLRYLKKIFQQISNPSPTIS